MMAPGRQRHRMHVAGLLALAAMVALLPACRKSEPEPDPGAAAAAAAATRSEAPRRARRQPSRIGGVVYLKRHPPVLRASVVLLGRDEDEVGAVEVRAEGKTTTLATAWEGVNFDQPETVLDLSEVMVGVAFGDLLAAEPPPPVDRTLYFLLDTATLTPASRQALAELIDEVEGWPAPEVSIAGHADELGSEEHNLALSRRRALAMRDALTAAGVDESSIEVAWFGETRPIPGSAGVGEENRRAEIRVR